MELWAVTLNQVFCAELERIINELKCSFDKCAAVQRNHSKRLNPALQVLTKVNDGKENELFIKIRK